MSNLPRVAAAVAALLLLGTAAYHGTFYNEVSQSIANSSADAFLKRAVPAFWIFLSWHLAALALACVWAAVRGGPAARPLVCFTALVVTGDTLWLLTQRGFFAGTALLALAAICLAVAGLTWQAA